MESHSMNITTFSGFIRLQINIIHRFHEEKQHSYRTKASRLKNINDA